MILAAASHALVMAQIHAASFPPGETWGPDAIALQLGLPGTFGLLCPQGGVIRGMILCRIAGDEAEILTIAVHPSRRQRGIGTLLLREALCKAAHLGADRVFLEVAERNEPARALYSAAGFRDVGRRPRYYADGADALIFRADLTPCAAAG